MNKGELIAAIAERYYFGNKAEAERALKAVSDTYCCGDGSYWACGHLRFRHLREAAP